MTPFKPLSPFLRTVPPNFSSLFPFVSTRQLRRLTDHGATVLITLGGLLTILSIVGIFAYLFLEVAPLLSRVSGTLLASFPVKPLPEFPRHAGNIDVGIDEYMEVAYVLQDGVVSLYQMPSGEPLVLDSMPHVEPEHISAIGRSAGQHHRWGLGTRDGQVIPLSITFTMTFMDDRRRIHPVVTAATPIELTPQPKRIRRLAYQKTEDSHVIAGLTESGHLYLTKSQGGDGVFAMNDEGELLQSEIRDERVPAITALLLDSMGERLLAGTQDGDLLYWDVRDIEAPRLMEVSRLGSTITALSYLIGDQSIVVGTHNGTVEVWMPLSNPDTGGDPKLLNVRALTAHDRAVTAISPSQRDKGFITADASGNLAVHYSTSGQTLLTMSGGRGPLHGVMFSPKGDGAIVINQDGYVSAYHLDNEHPEATFSSLFGAVLYEGYQEALHMWQSTGGSDAFEPKFGLWPLMFGTLKGTFYAMVLATPLAVLGAMYTAMFMSPKLRALVKPTVEIMAALPTVVLGFLAGLWFAPLLEKIFPALSAIVVVIPMALVVGAFCWHVLPLPIQKQSGHALELLALFLLVSGSVWICLQLNHEIEAWVYDSDYQAWLSTTFGVGYDQRNALVIAFAMGMAVIPIIFSISEDSISHVPRHLIAGSLALGATRWQTLIKLVLVSASPGIFSALMIGLGRVVGETMIVLMATGNTPVMDLNLFNGFRTLSANIAVEMPEAPQGGTLYRLLCLAGLVLFVFTSIVNTIAEIVRQRLRARYSQF